MLELLLIHPPGHIYLILLPLLTAILHALITSKTNPNKKPPLAPNSLPIIGHSKIFFNQQEKLAEIIRSPTIKTPLFRFALPMQDLWFTRSPTLIPPILQNSKTYDFEPMKIMILRRVLRIPERIIHLAELDNSGVGIKPLPHTHIAPEMRYNSMEYNAVKDFARPGAHAALVGKYEENLRQWLDGCGIGEEWSTEPDLFIFVRDIVFRAATDAFFGPHLLRISPHLAQDMWEIAKYMPVYVRGLPAVFNLKAERVRVRCIQGLKRWRDVVLKNPTRADGLPEWNEGTGMKVTTLKNEVFDRFGWDDTSRAASDMAFLFGLNHNSSLAAFWFFFETLQSPHLFTQARKEITNAQLPSDSSPKFDNQKLLNKPLLQSIYAESLRMYVAILMHRKTRQEAQIGDFVIPKDKEIMVCPYTQHMDDKLWNADESTDSRPAAEFWGERFLSYSKRRKDSAGSDNASSDVSEDTEEVTATFSTDSPTRRWLPYGVGERLCPGRHFTKLKVILTFAVLSSAFDIELLTPAGWRPEPDMGQFGYGMLRPKEAVPIRIRRKVLKSNE